MDAQLIVPITIAVISVALAVWYSVSVQREVGVKRKLAKKLVRAEDKIPYLKAENGDVSLKEAVGRAPDLKGV